MNARQSLARLGLCCGLGIALTGCELVADFDRSKIPSSRDASTTDATIDFDASLPLDAAMDAAMLPDAAEPPNDGTTEFDASVPQDTGIEDSGDDDAGF